MCCHYAALLHVGQNQNFLSPGCLFTRTHFMCDHSRQASQPILSLVSSAHLHENHNQTQSRFTISNKCRTAFQASQEKWARIMLRSTSVHFMGTRSASFSTSATFMTSLLQPGRDALKATSDETNQPSIVRILNSRDCRWNAVGWLKRPRFTGKPTTVKPFPFGRPRFSTRGGSDAVTDSADTDVEAPSNPWKRLACSSSV